MPIGRTGATKLQMLAIGKGTRQHVLIAGKTGSGKSTLVPRHHHQPRALVQPGPGRVLSGRLQERRRVQVLRRQTPAARARRRHRERPRVRPQRAAARGCRAETPRRTCSATRARRIWPATNAPAATSRCRAPCCSSTSSRSSSPRTTPSRRRRRCCSTASCARAAPSASTCCSARRRSAAPTRWPAPRFGQMVIRIALQCNEADAHLIMDDDNPAPRLLTRPGEGIYNDQAGALEATARSRSSGCRRTSAMPCSTKWPRVPPAAAQRCRRRRSSSKAMPPPTCATTPSSPRCSRSPPANRPPRGPRLARRAQLDQRPHRGGLPAPERQPSARRRPARRALAVAAVDRHGFAGRAVSAGAGGVRRARSPRLRSRRRGHVPPARRGSCRTESASAVRPKSPT